MWLRSIHFGPTKTLSSQIDEKTREKMEKWVLDKIGPAASHVFLSLFFFFLLSSLSDVHLLFIYFCIFCIYFFVLIICFFFFFSILSFFFLFIFFMFWCSSFIFSKDFILFYFLRKKFWVFELFVLHKKKKI